jgi:SRSO17 transposase
MDVRQRDGLRAQSEEFVADVFASVPLIGPDAWAVDDVSFPKDGKMSVAVAHRCCGALGASRPAARSW